MQYSLAFNTDYMNYSCTTVCYMISRYVMSHREHILCENPLDFKIMKLTLL